MYLSSKLGFVINLVYGSYLRAVEQIHGLDAETRDLSFFMKKVNTLKIPLYAQQIMKGPHLVHGVFVRASNVAASRCRFVSRNRSIYISKVVNVSECFNPNTRSRTANPCCKNDSACS